MSEVTPMKASVVFAIGIAPAPIVKFDRLSFLKIQSGVFTPSLVAQMASPAGYKEADFPILAFEPINEKAMEELRTLFHARIDKAFDEYIRKWKEKNASSSPETSKPTLVKDEE